MIRRRLIWAFILQLLVVLSISGFYLRYRLGSVLENELDSKLGALAGAVAVQLDASLVQVLAPGDEGTRLHRALLGRLTAVAQQADLRRIVVLSADGRVWLDSDSEAPIGSRYVRFEFDRSEIARALAGQRAASMLFQGRGGVLYKSAYTPLRLESRIIGVVMVEGSAASLDAMAEMQRALLQIAIVMAVLSIALALLISLRVTRPILNLQREARRLGAGEMEAAIAVNGRDEVAFLARTLEEMRRSILTRVEQQKSMLAGVAHEIRNPLGGIELFAGLLRDDLDDPEMRQKAERILRETGNLKTLVENFLDYARPVIPRPQRCDVSEILRDVRELLCAEMAARNLRLDVLGDATLNIDPQHLKQMLLNLLLNAIQASNHDGVVQVQTERRAERWCIDVIDRGHGMSPEEQSRLFTPFFSSKEKGMGLGLAMVKSLAEANGGSAELIRSGESGAQFRLSFPAG